MVGHALSVDFTPLVDRTSHRWKLLMPCDKGLFFYGMRKVESKEANMASIMPPWVTRRDVLFIEMKKLRGKVTFEWGSNSF